MINDKVLQICLDGCSGEIKFINFFNRTFTVSRIDHFAELSTSGTLGISICRVNGGTCFIST